MPDEQVPPQQEQQPATLQQSAIEKPLLGLLKKYQKQIEDVLPAHLKPERMLKVIVSAINRTPELLECSPITVINAIITAAQLGLEPRAGSCYLLPFKNKKTGRKECQLIIDYRGKVDIALRSGQVIDVDAEVVYAADHFEIVRDERGKHIEHTPLLFKEDKDGKRFPIAHADRGARLGAFAVAWLRDGPPKCIFMPAYEVLAVKEKAKGGDSSFSPWNDPQAMDEMWKKTAVHRICKLLPQDPEKASVLAKAQEVDDRGEMGISLDPLIEAEPADERPLVVEGSHSQQSDAGQSRMEELRKQQSGPQPVADPVHQDGPISNFGNTDEAPRPTNPRPFAGGRK